MRGVGISIALGSISISAAETPNRQNQTIETSKIAPLGWLAITPELQSEALEQEVQPIAPAQASAPAVRGEQIQLTPPEPPPSISEKYLVLQAELDASYNARQCIIDRESREAGMYTAENPASSASGAYQWLNSSWRNYLPWAEEYYALALTSPEEEARGARGHAAYANAFTQDLVTSFALLHRDLAQNQKPWPYAQCWGLVGSAKQDRLEGPENGPPLFIQTQIG